MVTATGTYAVEDTVIVRYRTRDGASGVDVVVPLVTADGTALLVDRGWMATDNRGADVADVPAPPSGEVTVTGLGARRRDRRQHRRSPTVHPGDLQRGDRRGARPPVYGGFVDLRETPAPGRRPAGAGRAARARQRAALLLRPAVVVLRRCWRSSASATWCTTSGAAATRRRGADEAHGGQNARSMPPSTGSITPVTNDAAGDSRNAAARPNSSGSP